MAITVTVGVSGSLTWNGEPVSLLTLRRRLKQAGAKLEREPVFLRSDAGVTYRQVESLMKLWQRYGVWTGMTGNCARGE